MASPTPTSPSVSHPGQSNINPTLSNTLNTTTQESHPTQASTSSRPENGQTPSQNRPEVVMDLRHMTSAGALHAPSTSSRRVSQKVGSRSPASIPSSPTSVHSSSSAIFERDIEPIVAPSPSQLLHTASATSHLQNPHRIPRVKLEEQSVPSVLDSAAEILAGLQDEGDQMQVAVEAPAVSMFTDGGKSPMSYRSRSPSPGLASGPGAGSLLLSIPVSTSPTVPHQTTSPPRPTISTNVSKQQQQQQHDAPPSTQTPASISAATPTSAYFSTTSSVASGSAENSPKTTTREKGPELPDSPDRDALISPAIPNAPPPSAIEAGHGSSFSPSLFTFNATTSPPRSVAASSSPSQSMPSSPRQPNQTLSSSSPTSHSQKVAKRLSFMSYNDLLTSTPLSTVPLSSLTNSVEPPPHIPPVAGYPVSDYPHTHAGSNAPSIKGSPGVITSVKEREMLDDLGLVGGEWEREGLGRGLEERLEAIVGMGSPGVVGHA